MLSPRRLFLLLILPLAVTCAGLFWFFVYRLDVALEAAMAQRAQGMAAVTVRAVAPGVDFDNAVSVQNGLDALKDTPDLTYAVVLRQDSQLMAGLAPNLRPDVVFRPLKTPELHWTDDLLHIVAPIDTTGGQKGTLLMGFALTSLRALRETNMAVVGVAVGLVLLVGGLGSYLLAHYMSRRRAAEAARRRSEESFRLLIEALPDVVLIERGGRVVYANTAAARGLGFAHGADIVGQPATQILRIDDGARNALKFEQIHDVGQPVHLAEVTLIRRDGAPIPAEVYALPLVYHGEPAGVLLARNLTDRRNIQAQLIRADRMASMGTMAAGIAHEINNPMAWVYNNLSFALTELGRADSGAFEDVQVALRESMEGAERVRHIVQSLKTYARGEEETIGPVDVERALDAALNIVRTEVNHRATLARVRGDHSYGMGNEGRLVQVFVNLLSNAAQAITAGDPVNQQISVETSTTSDGRICVAIGDTGVGIQPENLPRLFNPFFTTKPVGVGTGLGLWICQGILTAIGGDITVESVHGKGTIFRVLIRSTTAGPPTASPSSPALSVTPSPTPVRGETRRRILLVDDEPRIAHSLARLFARDFAVVSELTGSRALARLREDRDFDVILCDLMMPEMNGIELFDAIRTLSPRLARRVIFLTGGAFSPEAQAFLDALSNEVVEKPFDGDALRTTIDAVSRRTGDHLTVAEA